MQKRDPFAHPSRGTVVVYGVRRIGAEWPGLSWGTLEEAKKRIRGWENKKQYEIVKITVEPV